MTNFLKKIENCSLSHTDTHIHTHIHTHTHTHTLMHSYIPKYPKYKSVS